MKMNILSALVALVACLTLQSCPSLSRKVDTLALFQPAQLAWSEVESDLQEGYTSGESAGDLTTEQATDLREDTTELGVAIEEKDGDALRMIPWPTMYPWAGRGIAAQLARGDIGPGVAESFRVHDAKFDEIMKRLRGTNR